MAIVYDDGISEQLSFSNVHLLDGKMCRTSNGFRFGGINKLWSHTTKRTLPVNYSSNGWPHKAFIRTTMTPPDPDPAVVNVGVVGTMTSPNCCSVHEKAMDCSNRRICRWYVPRVVSWTRWTAQMTTTHTKHHIVCFSCLLWAIIKILRIPPVAVAWDVGRRQRKKHTISITSRVGWTIVH